MIRPLLTGVTTAVLMVVAIMIAMHGGWFGYSLAGLCLLFALVGAYITREEIRYMG